MLTLAYRLCYSTVFTARHAHYPQPHNSNPAGPPPAHPKLAVVAQANNFATCRQFPQGDSCPVLLSIY